MDVLLNKLNATSSPWTASSVFLSVYYSSGPNTASLESPRRRNRPTPGGLQRKAGTPRRHAEPCTQATCPAPTCRWYRWMRSAKLQCLSTRKQKRLFSSSRASLQPSAMNFWISLWREVTVSTYWQNKLQSHGGDGRRQTAAAVTHLLLSAPLVYSDNGANTRCKQTLGRRVS